MDAFELIKGFIYILSAGLFYPVLLGLIALVGWTAVATGGFLRESLDRRRGVDRVLDDGLHALDLASRDGSDTDLALDAALGDVERAVARSLDRVRFMIRVGPSLGLMGTLIPMATALASLAGGDLPSLAESMVTAFATTVIGLAVGIAAYLISLARQRWASQDLARLEVHAERLQRELVQRRREDAGSDVIAEADGARSRTMVAEPTDGSLSTALA